MTLQDKQFEALQDMVQGEKKNELTYEQIKSYIIDLAKYLNDSHDCHLSPDDGCDTCRSIALAAYMAEMGLKKLEEMRNALDEVTEQEIELAQLQ